MVWGRLNWEVQHFCRKVTWLIQKELFWKCQRPMPTGRPIETKTPSLEFYHPHLLRTWVSRLQDLSRNPELQFHDCQREILQASTKRGFVSYDLPMISLLFRELVNQQGPDLCPNQTHAVQEGRLVSKNWFWHLLFDFWDFPKRGNLPETAAVDKLHVWMLFVSSAKKVLAIKQ